MTTGTDLKTFITGLNGDATIDETLLTVLVNAARTVLENERPWMVLRKIDTSLSVTTSYTWQTAISLASITDFSRFNETEYGVVIYLFESSSDRFERYILKPFEQRLEWKDVSGTCVYDENSQNLYLNGSVPFGGTLYLPYVSTSPDIDLSSSDAVWTTFPSRFLPVLGFYSVGIFKGAVDYDAINKQMLPMNTAVLAALKGAMETWDDAKQLASIASNDPTGYGYPRGGAIDRDA